MTWCDGCRASLDVKELVFEQADGRECRYCEACAVIYRDFVKHCLVVEELLNRQLDVKIAEMRGRIPLLLVPQDLPKKARALEGLVLG